MDNTKINITELNKVIRTMQDARDAQHREANNFNQLGADMVKIGVDDKLRARGWPVGTNPPKSESKII